MSRSGLYRAAKAGTYQRIARGIYRPADAPAADWDWIEAATRRSDATICLASALAFHDLTDSIPDALDIAIPRGSRIPATQAAINWHLFGKETFDLGREAIEIPGSALRMAIYSPERCIADAFRLRGDLGYELGRDALRVWIRRGGRPAALIAIATRIPRAKVARLLDPAFRRD
ncbi:MAG: type IV toxin-antitoxin system AbiEi family antitoxin domain-containing protein [Gammaproteobacteria bacterium]